MAQAQGGVVMTVAIPTLNEERYIGQALSTLVAQIDGSQAEVMVLDGGSTDRTAEIVGEFARAHPFIRFVPNPKRLQSAALNLAAELAAPTSRLLVRADAHALYPEGFIDACVTALRESGAASTVVPMRTVGRSCFQRAVAAAQNSPLGNGGARHRRPGASGFVEHGHHAVFDLAAFRSVGGYDESFSHNEDAELDQRLLRAGNKIYLCAEAVVDYFPRDQAMSLARQYYNHGKGRARTLLRHGQVPKLRQMAPPAALLGSVGGVALAALHPGFLALPIAYAALCNGVAAAEAARCRDRCLLALGLAAMVMHASWSLGFLRTLGERGWSRLAEALRTGRAPEAAMDRQGAGAAEASGRGVGARDVL